MFLKPNEHLEERQRFHLIAEGRFLHTRAKGEKVTFFFNNIITNFTDNVVS